MQVLRMPVIALLVDKVHKYIYIFFHFMLFINSKYLYDILSTCIKFLSFVENFAVYWAL